MSKEKVVLAYSGGLDTKKHLTMTLSAVASIVDRAKNWTDWMKEQNFPELLNYILKISLMNSVMTSSFLA